MAVPRSEHRELSAREILSLCADYRLAARRIVRMDSMGERRTVAIAALMDQLRAEDVERGIVAIVQAIVWREVGSYLLTGATPRTPATALERVPDPVVSACRSLLAAGLRACPTCRRTVPDVDTLSSWEALDTAAWLAEWTLEHAPEREAESIRRLDGEP